MNKQTGIIIGAIILVFGAVIGVSIWQGSQTTPTNTTDANTTTDEEYSLETVKDAFAKIDYNKYNLNSILSNNPDAGNLPENIKGNPKAPIVIYEYADYQCSYCALMNPYLNQIISDYGDKVALVFRTYILSYHPNGVIAASAANAAAIQGYWPEFKDLLFSNQNEWFYSKGDTLQEQFDTYFTTASKGKGDLEKFQQDMASEAVAQKVAFDMGAGDKMDIGGTPWLYLDGKWIENQKMTPSEYANYIRNLIDAKLSQN